MLLLRRCLVLVCLVAWLASSGTAGQNAALAPALGTWQMKQDGKADARSITVTFLRREGGAFLGVIEWWPDGPSRTLETFTARVEGSRRALRFDSRNTFSRVDDIAPGTYEADLAADGRSMTRFRSITHLSTGVTSTLHWQKADTPTYEPAVMASLAVNDDRHRLWHQLSANFTVDGLNHKPGSDRPLLEHLARASHGRTRGLANARLRFIEFFLQATAADEEAARAFAQDDLSRRRELLKFLGDVTGDEVTPQSIGALMKSAGLERAFDRRLAMVQLALVQVAFFNRASAELRADYQERGPGAGRKLNASKLPTEFKVANGRSYLAVRNDTGRDLHHCLLLPRMTPDQKQVDEFERQVKADNSLAPLMGPVFDLNVRSLVDSQKLLVQYHRLEKGMPAFLPLWRAGELARVEVGQPDAIRESAGAMDLWVGADEGQAELALEVNQVREIARAATPSKQRTGTRSRSTSPMAGPNRPGGTRPTTTAPRTGIFRPPGGSGLPSLPGGFGPRRSTPPERGSGGAGSAPKPKDAPDLFYAGSLWRGREFQLPRQAVDVEIEVLERNGENFRAAMRWGGRQGRIIEGTVKNGKVEWQGAKDERNPGTPHGGNLKGKRLEGEYSRPNSTMRLRFEYDYVPPEKP